MVCLHEHTNRLGYRNQRLDHISFERSSNFFFQVVVPSSLVFLESTVAEDASSQSDLRISLELAYHPPRCAHDQSH